MPPGNSYSEENAAQIDEETARFVVVGHQRVKKILSERRRVLVEWAHLLSEKESVQGEELRKMLAESKLEVVN
jgi:cell division protease FtsH